MHETTTHNEIDTAKLCFAENFRDFGDKHLRLAKYNFYQGLYKLAATLEYVKGQSLDDNILLQSRVRVSRLRRSNQNRRRLIRFNISLLLITSILCLTLGEVALAQIPSDKKKETEKLKADIYFLASDTLEGRGISTPGIELAAQYIRAEFKRSGLKSAKSDGSYYQSFTVAEARLHNVVGVVDGRGGLAHETIIIGAHYDHLGHGEPNSLTPDALRSRIYPGADDNASGTAALLELARRFAANRNSSPSQGRRRMVFIAFCAEEIGLVGSRQYVLKEPLFPIKDTVAMMNFDMVGRLRNEELGIAGNESAKEFADLLASVDKQSPLKVLPGGPEYPDDSDHAPFAMAGVPILYVCTGSHDDRHTPADTSDKINYEGLAKVVDFSEEVLKRLTVMSRPRFVAPQRRSISEPKKK